jgi:hypothetical protein
VLTIAEEIEVVSARAPGSTEIIKGLTFNDFIVWLITPEW